MDRFRALAFAAGLGTALLPIGARAATIESFSPEGVAKHVREVAVRFSEAIVPLGDPRVSAEPFAIDCPAQGSSRWADGRTWVHTFAEDLPAGVRCTFEVAPALRALSGAAITGQRRFELSSGGPSLVDLYPGEEEDIAEDQRFAIRLDGAATRDSIERHAFVRVAGLPDPIGIRILDGAEREATLANYDTDDWKLDDPAVLVIEARQRFAPESKVTLHWGAGIATPSGVALDEEETYEFTVRAPFGARFSCERVKAEADCVPLSPIRMIFSAPVAWDAAAKIALQGVGPERWPARRRWEWDGDALVDAIEFDGPFPPRAVLTAEVPPNLADDSGRAFAPAKPLAIRTDAYPALAKFASRFGVLEAASAVLPVTIRNLEADAALRIQGVSGSVVARHTQVSDASPAAIVRWLHAVGRESDDRSVFGMPGLGAAPAEIALPKGDTGEDAEVVGIPLAAPGLHVVEIESSLLGAVIFDPPAPYFVATAALVTNLAVHFKWGNDGSLVWVTSLDRGEPVAGVRVRVADCKGSVLADGVTDASGLAPIAGLPASDGTPSCNDDGYSDYTSGLLVVAEREGELGLAHTSWSDGIEPWRFEVPSEYTPHPWSASTVLDRMLFRAGETVHMKHVLRDPVLAGFAQVAPANRPERARIVHAGTLDAWDLPLEFGADGAALSEWEIPKAAKLGAYEIQIVPKGAQDWSAATTGTFRVEAFRVPLARGVIQPPSAPVVAASSFPVDVAVQYLAGGGASNAPVTVRTQTRERWGIAFPDYPGFTFASGDVAEGVRTRRYGEQDAAPPAAAKSQELVLDAAGTGRAALAVDEIASAGPREVQVELEFRDPNGEVQTTSSTVPVWSASRVVGIRNASVRSVRDAIRLETAVVDLEGAPHWLAGVTVDVYERLDYSSRKRVVGGFYAYENVEETKKLGTFCTGRTDRTGRFACEGAPPGKGDLIFVARSSDWLGRATATQTAIYVSGDDSWFSQGDGDRMDLLPEKPRYEPGETARFSVRMPFREATALVTVEREGVAERFVTKIGADDPTVAVPISEGHAPNVFVSVLAVRGRALAAPPTATVDLGKPAYRIGVAEIAVGYRANELAVKVTPERAAWKVRETARVRVSVRRADGSAPPPGTEIALAAVDEGLLELMPNKSWKLLDAMMGRRSYGVRTSTAQLQVVGKRHFGRKSVAAGGGGGRGPTRELFDTLLLWRGRVPLDAAGDATVEVPLNDSLTSFRIAAVATGAEHLFGTGEASIRTTQDLMILPGLPPVVREGDRFPAGFTIRNTTESAQTLTLTAKAEGAATLEPIALDLAPGESREVSWTVAVPAGAATIPFEVDVRSAAGASDRLRAAPRVVPAVPARVLQAELVQVRGAAEIAVERPADALPGRGGLAVALRPRLADGSDAIERMMREYPYHCLEQQVSTALALRDDARWTAVMEGLPVYLDPNGMARFFPGDGPGSEVLTAYVLAVADESRRLVPDAPRGRMLSALEQFLSGGIAPSGPVRGVDGPLRKLAAAEALARYGRLTADQVGALAIAPRELTNAGLLDWIGILERVTELSGRAAKLAEADRLLRARLSVQGTTLGFAASDGGADWLLATGDVAALRLVLARLHAPAWREDAPKLMRAALARQARGAWATTTANAWGVIALDAFSSAYERTPVAGTTAAALAGEKRELAWAGAPKGGVLDLPWPPARSTIALAHTGAGAPWAVVQSIAAVPLRAPIESGYRIARTIEPVVQKTPGVWSRGDVARVRLEIDAAAEASWVVASDPIPAGATLLGSGLGGDSALLTAGEKPAGTDPAWPAYTERTQEAFRRYYEWAPKGTFGFEYTVRFNQAGTFQLPPTRVEAMYSPEKMGEAPNAVFEVVP